MNRKILLALVGTSLLACNFLFPPTLLPPTPTPEPLEEPKQTFEGFTLIRLHPQDGDLQNLLAAQAEKAVALDRMPVVYFDATWCPPCRAIEAALEAKNQLMLDSYNGTYIIKLDVDEWGWDGSAIKNFRFEF